MSNLKRTPQIRPGSELFLRPEGSERSGMISVLVDSCEVELIWCKGSCAPLRAGDLALLERPVAGDARYVTTAEIEVDSPSRFAIRIASDWQRSQQREFVRISTHNIALAIERLERPAGRPAPRRGGRPRRRRATASEPAPLARLEMLDLSAGGLRFASKQPFSLEEQIRCHFELPETGAFDLLARIVRIERKTPGYEGSRWYAAEFSKLGDPQRSALLRWVFQEQLRRHREFKRG